MSMATTAALFVAAGDASAQASSPRPVPPADCEVIGEARDVPARFVERGRALRVDWVSGVTMGIVARFDDGATEAR